MIKELIESVFFYTYPKKKDATICITEKFHTGTFQLHDNHACISCRYQQFFPCERVNIILSSDSTASEISIAEVLDYVENFKEENADFLVENSHTIAFIELTCSETLRVDGEHGKRNKAISQLRSTIEYFRLIINS